MDIPPDIKQSMDDVNYAENSCPSINASTVLDEGYNTFKVTDITEDNDVTALQPKTELLPQCKIKRNYSCGICVFFTQNPRIFLTHLRDIHGEKIVINECKLCLYASRHYQKLVRHMKMVHGSIEGIEEHANARKRQLGRETRKRRSDDILTMPNKIEQTQVQQSVKADDDETPESRLLKCSLCDFTTLYKAQLVEHEQEEHYKTKFFRCEKCSYVTHIKARYSKHVKYHSMPMIKCVTCDFRTPYKWNLDRHMKNHGGSGPFKCAACNFTADIKQSLTVHEMNHHVPPVGHAAGMSMARRKNKVGGTDIVEDFISENGDIFDSYNNNNNTEDFENPLQKKIKIFDDEQPTDLSRKFPMGNTKIPKKTSRPVPNLIPIQLSGGVLNLSKNYCAEINSNSPILDLSKSTSDEQDQESSEECEQSNESLKEIAAIFLGEGNNFKKNHQKLKSSTSSSASISSSTRQRNASIFDCLKLTLETGNNQNSNLICECGYTSKCLSESIIHKKNCVKNFPSSPSPINLSINGNSIRCKFCRHRCKSSSDLSKHIQNCPDAVNFQNESSDNFSESTEKTEEHNEMVSQNNQMENSILIWNRLADEHTNGISLNDQGHMEDDVNNDQSKSSDQPNDAGGKDNSENSYYGVETAPGYGEVTKLMTPEEEAANSSLKKVYKCPHCSFWASTASRFHVHIVGHLNKKPFECSLCAYRSNWRWDITKHIRLKTIRDPSHKNAGVLMNDETGRRNYTKYNKYITLMKVTEEDGDPKLMKSGEMTPNQEASLSFINSFNSAQNIKEEVGADTDQQNNPIQFVGNNSQVLDPSKLLQLPIFKNAVFGITKNQPQEFHLNTSAMMKNSDEIVTQNIDIKTDGPEKRTSYKCKNCNFKDANRDIVLEHVKIHYEEVGINLTKNDSIGTISLHASINPTDYVNNVLAAMCLSHQKQIFVETNTDQQSSQINNVESNSTITNQQLPNLPSSLNLPSTSAATTTSDHGEMDEASSGVTTTTGTGDSRWRGPSPYRCGHCHQVSNWKHVIQRHCRLKHSGDIRIEAIDKNSNTAKPTYHSILVHSEQTANSSTAENIKTNETNLVTNKDVPKNPIKHTQNVPILCQNLQNTATTSTSDNQNNLLNENQKGSDTNISITKGRRQQCKSCPFISESKSQMMYHSSLHKYKPEEYSCNECNFKCCKKQILSQHIKMCHEKRNDCNGFKVKKESNLHKRNSEKYLSFCIYCPARFIGNKELRFHILKHTSNFPYQCKLCSYTAEQESFLKSHKEVHTILYNEKTERLLQNFKESPMYTRPILLEINSSENEKVVVAENVLHKENNSDETENLKTSSIGNNIETVSTIADCASNTKDKVVKKLKICLYCPFETNLEEEFNAHIKCHCRKSKEKNLFTCDHCDYSVSDEKDIKEHLPWHFKAINKRRNLDYYATFSDIELFTYDPFNGNKTNEKKVLFNSALYESDSDDSDNAVNQVTKTPKILVDVMSGEIVSSL